ncbi:TlpA family protein disulfide reductase [Pedobacter nutrimenti]|uniref:Thioredoxin-like protein n=1 Tax=Pedobacter nutrimenti TaxID=1241337 RepID=A0A318UJJ2_9SPHI|nr:TlpA disulfide reductase family protein [Pedobacter nutrimenti]PYF76544.1 thioredoxin-like protein [Pedobacter nutrimenti]
MSKKIKLLILFCIICQFANGQNGSRKEDQKIIISGYIADSCLKNFSDSPEIYFYDQYNETPYNRSLVIPISIKNNRFVATIKNEGRVGYFRIKDLPILGIYQNFFLIESGDSLSLNILTMKDMCFTGKGSEKMNYQLWIGKQWFQNFKSFNSINDTARIYYDKQRMLKMMSTSLDSLDFLRKKVGDDVYRLLKYNTLSAIKNECLTNSLSFIKTNDSVYRKALKKRINELYHEQSTFVTADTFIVKNSFIYSKYLFNLNKYYVALTANSIKPSFGSVYNFINEHFSGMLRDRLMLNCFVYMMREKGVSDYIFPALNTVKDDSSKEGIELIAKSRIPGAKAYNFSLEGIDGKYVKLEDFKGKVVLMDSWFEGCINCTVLSKQLAPVIDYFKNNQKVVFLGVNVDRKKEKFIEGVNSGQYTSDQTISVYTNGLGERHPMLEYYQYDGYPNLLLINKEGVIISANPPRPINKERTEQLIKLINENL